MPNWIYNTNLLLFFNCKGWEGGGDNVSMSKQKVRTFQGTYHILLF